MPKFRIELTDGRKFMVEADKQPSEQEVLQQLGQSSEGLPTKAAKDQYLPIGERFKGGFMQDEQLAQTREQQRSERGLAPGTPLEPTGFNLENLLDLPGDLADIVGKSLPILGASIGGLTAGAATLPTGVGALAGVAGGGAAGGAVGELVRQEIGKRAFRFEQGEVLDRLGDIAREGMYGSVQEVGGVALGRMINATKLGIINLANKLIEKRGAEGLVRGFGGLATHVDKTKINFALDAVKRGDKRVLDKVFADSGFADRFAKKLISGEKGNFAQNVYNLAHRTKEARQPIRDLFVDRLGLIKQADFDIIYNQGNKVNRFRNPQTILKLGEQINSGLDNTFTKAGKELEIARRILAKKASLVEVPGLTEANTTLAESLRGIGLLTKEGKGLYGLNPKFSITQTGKGQANIYAQLLDRFFSKRGLEGIPLKGDKVKGVFTISNTDILKELVSGTKAGRKVIFDVNKTLKYGEFADLLGTLDVQISGAEFKQLGKLSPDLTVYLRNLREIPIAVEQKIGGSQVATLTNSFRELAENASLLRQGGRIKSVGQIERALQRLVKSEPGTTASVEAEGLNSFLQKNLGINFLDELRAFKTAQTVKQIESSFGTTNVRQGLVGVMKDAFSEGHISFLNDVSAVDKVLPKDLRIAENAMIHTTAEGLTKNAASILRGKFMWNAAIAPIIGGGIGAMGGPAGATAGVVAGLAIQQPGILRHLIQASAKLSNVEVRKMVGLPVSNLTKQAVRATPATARLLAELIRKR